MYTLRQFAERSGMTLKCKIFGHKYEDDKIPMRAGSIIAHKCARCGKRPPEQSMVDAWVVNQIAQMDMQDRLNEMSRRRHEDWLRRMGWIE